MKNTLKRIVSFALLLAMLLSLLPVTFAAEKEQPEAIAEEVYDDLNADIWNAIAALEETELPAVRGKAPTAADYAALAEDIIALVEASDTYKKGTLINKNGFLAWETTYGVTCGYSPALRARVRKTALSPSAAEIEAASGVETVSYAERGTASSINVAVFQPYYGLDSSFTTQYVNEGKSVAKATGGTSTTYKVNSATIDALADAMETSGVVFFDSHGTTDYEKYVGTDPYGGDLYDCTSQANTSYICLQNGEGLTTEDYKTVSGTYGTYSHAYYSGSSGSMRYYCVDGTAIANHMEKKAPNNLLWMAICLGMATDGMQAPLRDKGVGVVYGYSQSVTFDYDYAWETVFFREMKKGANVSAAIGAMKSEVGTWDCYQECPTISSARRNYCAFPIVVSDEDTYPGKGNVDALQTVRSTWTLPLGGGYKITAASNDETLGTVSVAGNVVTATVSDAAKISGWQLTPAHAGTVTREGDRFILTNLTGDCHLTVYFEAKPRATVHYSVPDGCTKADSFGYVGEEITLSRPEGSPTADAQTYSFVGWKEVSIEEDTASKPFYYETAYTPTKAETTLYAVYQYQDKDLKTYYTTNLQNKLHYTVAAESNDETLGTVALQGDVVTANAKEGAYIAGFTLTPANAATVTREGSRFILSNVTADCLLTVNFAPKPRATVHYSVPDGCTQADSLGYVGEEITLSRPEGTPTADAQSYSFAGWTETPLKDTTSKPTYYKTAYTPTKAETTLYALYQYQGKDMKTYYTTNLQNKAHAAIAAASNDETLGTVTLQDNVVTANAKEGAYIAGFTLTPANAATVTREDNRFILLNVTADCLLTVNFAPESRATVHYSVPDGCTKADSLGYVGEEIPLSKPEGSPTADAQSYRFIGWALASVQDSKAAPEYLTETFTPKEAETTLYALYSYEANGARYYTTKLQNRICYLKGFTDTDADAWYHEAVDFVVGSGYMNGVAEDRFDPQGKLTRAMLATILYRKSGETGGSHPFTDVKKGAWYDEAIAWAYTSGVVNGTSATTFHPNANVTREQAAAMLYRYAAHMGEDTTATGDLNAFRDAGKCSAYALVPLRWAVGNRILNGKGNGILDPTGTATRAEIAQILLNLAS